MIYGRYGRPRTSSGQARSRRRVLAGVALFAAGTAASGLLAATALRSPAQLTHQSGPPPPALLTGRVARQVVSVTVLAQGVVSESAEVSGPVPFRAARDSDSTRYPAAQPVLTRVFLRPGHMARAGSLLAEVGGRPVVTFEGSVPVYRNLRPGESGPDIAQLQKGLKARGYPTGLDPQGVFGSGTAAAVRAFYGDLGYHVRQATGPGNVQVGPMVPGQELMFVPRLPARVVSYSARVGQLVRGQLVTLATGRPVIRGQVSPGDRDLVRPGSKAEVRAGGGTSSYRDGTVTAVSGHATTRGSIAGGSYLRVTIVPRRPMPAAMAGQDVQVVISAPRTSRKVLTVPEAAVFATADGGTYVTKVMTGRRRVRVPVQAGVTGSGMVEVTPAGGPALAPGDRVLTGTGYARSWQAGAGPG